ncbi:methylated-DNA--[protein]-cysteine S-methyltransferase [Streptococcus massiliensis]|uniref:Methylated-DNA--protein-cysteine methyltransferase n=1 Tax=Streptococcus massiliensis TaxID=313439 RepID=A0A380L019_9STRE|nr:methylated-DNA--[protein]-cysteine S-methyltransferase [Streptococcus massiliensis]SUN76899.1 methylated-DNA-[protein]-cysteine S-methyltransferase [Streptococcus massiliensis]
MEFYQLLYSSPVGDISLVSDGRGLQGIWFLHQKYYQAGLDGDILEQSDSILAEAAVLLDDYFAGKTVDFSTLPLSSKGTDFQKRVWAYLQEVPSGQTVTYGQIAKDLRVKSAQAVGGAVGRNPWSIIVPCHRVLGSQGQLTGYAGGLDKKIWLLEHEGVNLASSKNNRKE